MIEIFFLILLIISIPLFIFFIIPLLYSGIHYEKTKIEKIKTIKNFIKNLNTKKTNLKICDIGSGNADVLIAMAKSKKGNYEGFEINPILVILSKLKIKKQKLSSKIKIHNKNFWKTNFKKFDILFIFQFSNLMKKIENKILRECKKGTIIISNHWEFPNIKPIKKKNDLFIYKV